MSRVPPVDWTSIRRARLPYSYGRFARAKGFVFERWCELAAERAVALPADLSGACKYGSLFVQSVFGGSIRGHFEHQYNCVEGRLVDLGHDALDVGRMGEPYRHEAAYFELPEVQARLAACVPRAERWADAFLRDPALSG
ncbi:hypothetical protein [Rubrivivax gelatinosus]|uniref:hypothetical protein n=1 Tax=Rubrivivax gelatinosus TaxID=28068 RepID=UPI001903C8F5|nr:hypothetical protein [Rubrivivax gelatinosus]